MVTDHLLRVCGDLGVNVDTAFPAISMAVNGADQWADSEIYQALFTSIAAMHDRPDLPVLIGENSASRPTHLLYFLIASSPNLERAVERLVIYVLVTEPQNARIWCADEKRDVWFELCADDPLSMIYAGIHMVRLVAIARQVTGTGIVPVSVSFPQGAPQAALDTFQAFFGAKISVGTPGLRFSAKDMQRKFAYFDPTIWASLEADLNMRLRSINGDMPFREKVERAISQLLPRGQTSLADVAAHLAIGWRSLQRRLQEEGLSFRDMRETTRMQIASSYLKKQALSKTEVAYRLGFRDPNSFFRLYRQWVRAGKF